MGGGGSSADVDDADVEDRGPSSVPAFVVVPAPSFIVENVWRGEKREMGWGIEL